jgi:pimeloyl-ACP methyl ester carboxylesterase
MAVFSSHGFDMSYEVWGEGPAVLLIHGFGSTGRVNWVDTGWVRTLETAGYRAITFDNRGHGASTKFHDPAAYAVPLMAGDALGLLAHLGIQTAVVMGYSMGAKIAATLVIGHCEKARAVILSGLAENMMRPFSDTEIIAEALETMRPESISDPVGKTFRAFGEQTGSDLRALAACMRGSRTPILPEELAAIAVPALVVAGSDDPTAGAVEPLVKVIPGAEGVVLPRRNHMNAVGDRGHKDAVLRFLHKIDAPERA